MTPSGPRRDVIVSVYVPTMFIALGFSQGQSFWNEGDGLLQRTRQVWKPVPPPKGAKGWKPEPQPTKQGW